MAPAGRPDEKLLAELRALARGFSRELEVGALEGLGRYVELLHTWNARINLTGARTPGAIVSEQLPDSFALAGVVPRGARLVDVGSGGGLPAIPFGLLRPDVALTLVEPRSRRRAFLTTAVRELGLRADLRPDRAEDLAAGGFDAASARAVLPPAEWLLEGQRLVVPGGLVVLFLSDTPWVPPEGVSVSADVSYPAGAGSHRLVALSSRAA